MQEPYDRFEHAGLVVEIVPDGEAASPQEHDNAGTLYSWTPDFVGDESIREPDYEDTCPVCEGEDDVPCRRCKGAGWVEVDLPTYFANHYDAALTIPLRFSDERYRARIYECDPDDANCALVFTQAEIDEEWDGHAEAYQIQAYRWIPAEDGDPIIGYADGGRSGPFRERVPDGFVESGARPYAKARINELDEYLRGDVYGIVVREPSDEIEGEGTGFILISCWNFIGDPSGKSGEWIYAEARAMAEGCAEEIERERAEVHRWACADVVTV